MFHLFKKTKKQQVVDETVDDLNQAVKDYKLTKSLEKNVVTIKELFVDVDILRVRDVTNNNDESLKYSLLYCDGVVDTMMINESVIKPLMLSCAAEPGRQLIETLITKVIQVGESEETTSVKDIVEAISYGDTVLFADGYDKAIIINTKSFTVRSIAEPDNEKTLSGPREGFTETLMTNLSLIRRKVRTNALKMKFYGLGKRSRTQTCICYIEGIVNKKVLDELYKRLATIDIDAILDANYIVEMIRDNRYSPFRSTYYTERPDIVIGKLLEGRIAIFVDGSPVVITIPYLFIENFQSSEDYYVSFYYTSFSRFLRIFAFFLTVTVPAFYIAIVAFHHEMLPTQLLISITAERQSVPLPAALEAFIMIIVFDLLRETGIRMPTGIGQSLSIVGALVIGQAAVEAKLVAAPMIIVVGITGITTLIVPKLTPAVIPMRFFLLLLATMFGFYGLMLGIAICVIHVLNLRSFGIPQLMLSGNLKYQEIKDTFFRAPWWQMRQRPKILAADKTRMKRGGGNG